MQILAAIFAILTLIGLWAWRIRMAKQGLDAVRDATQTVANAPRRLAFRWKASRGQIDLVDDPREAAAIMLVELALARGEALTPRQSDIIESEIAEHFRMTPAEAEELAAHAAWIAGQTPSPDDVMRKMGRKIVTSPQLGPKEIVDLDAMLVAVSEAEGLPTRKQLALLQVYRDLAGLKT